MKNISLLNWICNNMSKWEIICGIDNRQLTKEEIENLFYEMLGLASESEEFSAIFIVVLSKYYYDIFPTFLSEP